MRRSATSRRFQWIALLVLSVCSVIVLSAVGIAMVAYPAAAAAACPTCYGFEQLRPSLFVERSTMPDQRAKIIGVVDQARARVAAFYGEASSSPRILVCATQGCYRKVGGGGSRGIALLDRALVLSPRGTNVVIAAHELSHAELHHRLGLGLLLAFRRAVPQWFDEGLAVVISNDPRYVAASGGPDRCRVVSTGDLPETTRAWIHGAANDDLYLKASCRVSRWIASKGGRSAVKALIAAVAGGTDFRKAYGSP